MIFLMVFIAAFVQLAVNVALWKRTKWPNVSETDARWELNQVRGVLYHWYLTRNSLSADCKDLGISGHARDSGRWGQELSARCEPLRTFCDGYFASGVCRIPDVTEQRKTRKPKPVSEAGG